MLNSLEVACWILSVQVRDLDPPNLNRSLAVSCTSTLGMFRFSVQLLGSRFFPPNLVVNFFFFERRREKEIQGAPDLLFHSPNAWI